MTARNPLVLSDATLQPSFIDKLVSQCAAIGITINDRLALHTAVAGVHACFDSREADLTSFNGVIADALRALEKSLPAVEAARQALVGLDGREYGEVAHRLASGEVDAGVDTLDASIADVRCLTDIMDKAAVRLRALAEASATPRRSRGHQQNSPRIYHAVRVLCEFWEADQRKPASPYSSDGANKTISLQFIEQIISSFINTENKAAGQQVIGTQWKTAVATEMGKWKAAQRASSAAQGHIGTSR